VPRVVICPSCQSKGAVPEDAKVARIRCPRCGVIFDVSADAGPSGSVPAPGARRPASPPPIAPSPARYDESDVVHNAPSGTHGPVGRRSPAPAPAGASAAAGNTVLLYALLGVSGLVVVLLGVVLALVLTRGGGGGGQPVPIANAVPTAQPEAPTASAPGAPGITPTVLTAGSGETRAALAPAPTPAVAATTPSPSVSASAPASPPDPREILRQLKDATVLVNIKIGKTTLGNGSGFVVEVDGDRVLVATNRHVAVVDMSELPPRFQTQGFKPTLEVVLRSGLGSEEQVLPAEIVAADLSGEMNVDLAFLRVRGVNKPPKPLDPMNRIQPIEGMTYVGAGFPFAGAIKIAEHEGKPSVVITGGRVSSFKRDEFGQLLVLQVDGSVQPGNSGGPIIDEKTGKLLGVAVAKASMADTIGFIVPADEVRRALAGRVGGMDLALEASNQQGIANLHVKAILMDPKMQVGGVLVHAASASTVGKLTPDSDGNWPALPNTKPFELQRDSRTPTASGQVQVALSGGGDARRILVQTAHRDLLGRLHYSKPKEVTLPDKPGRIRPAGGLPRVLNLARAPSLKKLGPLIDPAKDCRMFKDDQNFKVTIDIPGKLHTLSPKLTDNSNRPIHNAPMTLTEVEGDFVSIVQISGEINPGSTLPRERAVRGLPFTFQSAGLIVYQDKNNFFRLERAGSIVTRSLTPLHRLVIEAVRDGKQAMEPIYLNVRETELLLILQRRNNRIKCMFVPKESHQIFTFREFAFSLPSKVKVGLSATNISAQPFTATFENFTLLGNTTELDEELND
jgi:regulation of enolase protein 1 (concanavalin A-like superfamily)